MGRGKPVLVGDQRFTSKKEATAFIQRILYRYAIGQHVVGDDAKFLSDLIELHPQRDLKVGCGIAFFSVEQNDGSCGFWLTRSDRSRTDWSFLACLTPPTPEVEARNGFRSAVRSQKSEFRDSVGTASIGRPCPISGEMLTQENLQVDHEIPFAELLDAFLLEQKLLLAEVQVKPTSDGSTVTELADDDLRRRWQEYHRQNARLRVVSASANLSILRRHECSAR